MKHRRHLRHKIVLRNKTVVFHYKGCYYNKQLEPINYSYGLLIQLIGNTLQEAYENYLLKQL